MALMEKEAYVLGLDYGTDSCRAVLIDASNGREAGVAEQNMRKHFFLDIQDICKRMDMRATMPR